MRTGQPLIVRVRLRHVSNGRHQPTSSSFPHRNHTRRQANAQSVSRRDSVNSKMFIATTGQGIARALQGADDQWGVEFLLADCDVRCLAADALNKNVIYAGTQGSGVLRSTDAGKTWQPAGMTGQIIKALAVSSIEPGTIYAGTKPAQIFVSRDSGANWIELTGFRRVRRWFWFSPAESPFSAYV